MGEFELIHDYFVRRKRADLPENFVQLSIGDDCAITEVPSDQRLAITTDTLVCGTHFLPDINPKALAYKAIAVNLSDLAAMGATPRWVSLALTLPAVDPNWLGQFSTGLFEILEPHQVALIGGDTTKGPLSISVTAQGFLPKNGGLFRHQAQIGDFIYVSGNLGDSAAGLALLLENQSPNAFNFNAAQQALIGRHLRPTPRLALGQQLLAYSRCGIDISDGLLADLSHILKRSQCAAEIWLEKLPLSAPLRALHSEKAAQTLALTGGEDYELCFTISPEKQPAFEQMQQTHGFDCHCIGKIVPLAALQAPIQLYSKGKPVPLPAQIGFDHFRQSEPV